MDEVADKVHVLLHNLGSVVFFVHSRQCIRRNAPQGATRWSQIKRFERWVWYATWMYSTPLTLYTRVSWLIKYGYPSPPLKSLNYQNHHPVSFIITWWGYQVITFPELLSPLHTKSGHCPFQVNILPFNNDGFGIHFHSSGWSKRSSRITNVFVNWSNNLVCFFI